MLVGLEGRRMSIDQDNRTGHIALALSERRQLARTHLLHEMAARGLTEREGWKVVESVRQVPGGTELVLRPLHLHSEPPGDLECVVKVRELDGAIDPDGEHAH
jgi:hypothetical protein